MEWKQMRVLRGEVNDQVKAARRSALEREERPASDSLDFDAQHCRLGENGRDLGEQGLFDSLLGADEARRSVLAFSSSS